VRIAYADPPNPGQSRKHYEDHKDYAGEVDHAALIERLRTYDGWILHSSATAMREIITMVPEARVGVWVKPFAAFKRNVPVAYTWEPVYVVAARKPVVGGVMAPLRDHISEPITMKRGLAGAKPERVVWWCLEMAGYVVGDTVEDLFPGTGAVTRAVETYNAIPRTVALTLDCEMSRRLLGEDPSGLWAVH
jgi:hypothetical protein